MLDLEILFFLGPLKTGNSTISTSDAMAEPTTMAIATEPDPLQLKAFLTENSRISKSYFSDDPLQRSRKRQKQDSISKQNEDDDAVRRRFLAEYAIAEHLPKQISDSQISAASNRKKTFRVTDVSSSEPHLRRTVSRPTPRGDKPVNSSALVLREHQQSHGKSGSLKPALEVTDLTTRTIKQAKPDWHPPWKLMRVISGHLGWVRSLTVEPGNRWFASGAGDRTIKIWDLATGSLKLTLTGHISTVRGLAVSPRHPYLFSCGEDKMVKCWDLETNKVIRHYHGHLSGVYTLSLHPTLDVLVTGGRDGVARVWDMRTRSNIHVLSGHTATVSDVKCQESDPQVISASLDATVRLWDLVAGKTMGVLTHHKKGVRALAIHPSEFTFATGSTGSIKQWKCPEGAFIQNFEGQNAIVNTLSVSAHNVLFAGGMSS
jgi:pleiotropic regulator 1